MAEKTELTPEQKQLAAVLERLEKVEKESKATKSENAKLKKTLASVKKDIDQAPKKGKKPVIIPSKYDDFELEEKDGAGKVVSKTKYVFKPNHKKNNKINNPIAADREPKYISIDEFVEQIQEGNTTIATEIIARCSTSKAGFKHCAFEPVEA